jgi:hypothetical protein
VICLLTTPRRPQFLAATLRALDGAGAREMRRLICVDGRLQDVLRLRVVPPGWEMQSIGTGDQGTQVAFHAALLASWRAGGPEDLLFFEDDIQPCRNAVTALARIPVPDDLGFLSAFDHRNLMRTITEPTLLRIGADDSQVQGGWGFWGNQALKIPGRALAHLVKQRTNYTYAPGVSELGRARSLMYGSDVWLGAQAASADAPWKRYGLIAPSLFQHVGAMSAVGKHWRLEQRVAINWRGDFDALTLPWVVDATPKCEVLGPSV